MSDNTLQKSIYLRASKAQVWSYLTDPEKLAIWFHKPNEPLQKGAYAMHGTESGDKLMWGDVSVFEPHDRLEMSFTIAPMGGAVSQVKWQLAEVDGGTRLSLEHTGLPPVFDLTLALDKGWDDHLGRMRVSLHA